MTYRPMANLNFNYTTAHIKKENEPVQTSRRKPVDFRGIKLNGRYDKPRTRWRDSDDFLVARNCKSRDYPTMASLRTHFVQEAHINSQMYTKRVPKEQQILKQKGYWCNFLNFDYKTGKVIYWSRLEGDDTC